MPTTLFSGLFPSGLSGRAVALYCAYAANLMADAPCLCGGSTRSQLHGALRPMLPTGCWKAHSACLFTMLMSAGFGTSSKQCISVSRRRPERHRERSASCSAKVTGTACQKQAWQTQGGVQT